MGRVLDVVAQDRATLVCVFSPELSHFLLFCITLGQGPLGVSDCVWCQTGTELIACLLKADA